MDDLTLRYFDAEMRYLREAGEEFARAHPDRAAALNLDKSGARDPYVERLFEGFAFLMGRLREKLDDDLPELTEGLVSLLWPHYLRTIPSLSIVEFTPEWQGMKERMLVAKGFEVLSRPIAERATRCRYTTTQDIDLLPLSLQRAGLDTEPDGRSVVRLRFECGELADWSRLDLSRLPLYFDADAPLACALHEALTLNTAKLWIRLPGQADRQPLDGYFAPQGFSEKDTLWPKGDTSFSGYQLLLEYFTFREKFMFVALKGLDTVELPSELKWFEIDVVLEKRWEHDFSFSEKHLRLHCVPVINLFPLESDPLSLSSLANDGEGALKDDLLASRSVVVKPGNAATLDMPMEKDAKFVAIVALFRHPDMAKDHWRVLLTRNDLDPDDPRTLDLGDNSLTLRAEKE